MPISLLPAAPKQREVVSSLIFYPKDPFLIEGSDSNSNAICTVLGICIFYLVGGFSGRVTMKPYTNYLIHIFYIIEKNTSPFNREEEILLQPSYFRPSCFFSDSAI